MDIYRVLFILMTYSLKNNGLKIDVFTLRQKGIYPLLETSDITILCLGKAVTMMGLNVIKLISTSPSSSPRDSTGPNLF